MSASDFFDRVDTDRSGSIDSTELVTYMLGAGTEPEYISELFTQIDLNGDGKISREEWAAAYDSGALTGGHLALTPKLLGRVFDGIARAEARQGQVVSWEQVNTFISLLLEQTLDEAQCESIETFSAAVGTELFENGEKKAVTRAAWCGGRPLLIPTAVVTRRS